MGLLPNVFITKKYSATDPRYMLKSAKKLFDIRDPVHGTIQFTSLEKRIIDHPYIQRLRYIHQLGFVFFVYPGATHDRFSHALGAMHIAGRLWGQIVNSSRDFLLGYMTMADIEYLGKIVRLAGLLHDSGHGPFSHTSEELLPQLKTLDVPREWYGASIKSNERATHEDYSVMVIASLARGKNAPISIVEAQDIASLVHHRIKPSEEWNRRFSRALKKKFIVHDVVQSFVSGDLDCDRMDYLMRDAHHTGVPYGFYDIDRLISALSLISLSATGGIAQSSSRGEVHVALDYTGIRAFEDFLLARYHMLLQVYFHKTANCFDYFLKQAFIVGELSYAIPAMMEKFAHLRDSSIFEKLFFAAQNPKNVWSRRLISRTPATLVFSTSMLREGKRKELDKKLLLRKIIFVCAKKGVVPIIVSSAQHLYRSPAKKRSGAKLFVVKRVMGEDFYEPIEKYSNLLQKYNEEINLFDAYILKEDYPKVASGLKKLLVGYQQKALGT